MQSQPLKFLELCWLFCPCSRVEKNPVHTRCHRKSERNERKKLEVATAVLEKLLLGLKSVLPVLRHVPSLEELTPGATFSEKGRETAQLNILSSQKNLHAGPDWSQSDSGLGEQPLPYNPMLPVSRSGGVSLSHDGISVSAINLAVTSQATTQVCLDGRIPLDSSSGKEVSPKPRQTKPNQTREKSVSFLSH